MPIVSISPGTSIAEQMKQGDNQNNPSFRTTARQVLELAQEIRNRTIEEAIAELDKQGLASITTNDHKTIRQILQNMMNASHIALQRQQ